MSDNNLPELMTSEQHFQWLDRKAAQQAHELEMKKQQTLQVRAQQRTHNWESFLIFLGGLLAVALVVAGILGLYHIYAGPSDDEIDQRKFKYACIEQGGTYLPDAGGCIAEGNVLIEDGSLVKDEDK